MNVAAVAGGGVVVGIDLCQFLENYRKNLNHQGSTDIAGKSLTLVSLNVLYCTTPHKL